MDFFQSLEGLVNDIFKVIEEAGTSGMIKELTTLLSVSLSLMIMIKAYAFLAGKSN